MLKKIVSFGAGVVGSFMLMVQSSFATIDVTAVTTGITDAQTALSTIIAALLALSVAIYGIVLVYRFVKRRAGA